jgi:hypothetical protein
MKLPFLQLKYSCIIIKVLNLFILLSFLSSCSKDLVLPKTSSKDCINEVQDTNKFGGCDRISNNPPQTYCDVQHIDEFVLEESSKEYVPQFCLQIGDTIKFHDDHNHFIYLKLIEKWFKHNESIYTHTICDKDSTKKIGYCFGQEVVFMALESEFPKISLWIVLRTEPDNGSDYNGNYADELNILRQDTTGYYLYDFSVIINKRTLTRDSSLYQIFYPSISLNGQNYLNVLSYDSKINRPTFKFYYSKEKGLIGFKDKDGILWSL